MAIAVSSSFMQCLTPAEQQVAVMQAGGAPYKTIAKVLGKSPATVRNQLHAVYQKLGVANRTALACKRRAATLAAHQLQDGGGGLDDFQFLRHRPTRSVPGPAHARWLAARRAGGRRGRAAAR